MAKLKFLMFTQDMALPGGTAELYRPVQVEMTERGSGIRPPPWRLGGLPQWPTRLETVLVGNLKKH